MMRIDLVFKLMLWPGYYHHQALKNHQNYLRQRYIDGKPFTTRQGMYEHMRACRGCS